MKLLKGKKIIWVVLVVIVVWYSFNLIQVRSYSKKYYDTVSDVALVLGAGTNEGTLSPVFKERVNHSINLLGAKKVKYILLTGGYGKGQNISDSKAAKLYAMSLGVDSARILIEEESTITFFNIQKAKNIMKGNNLTTALIVSDPYHMRRSKDMCDKIGIEALPSPTPTTMYKTRKSKIGFLITEAFNYSLFLLFEQFREVE